MSEIPDTPAGRLLGCVNRIETEHSPLPWHVGASGASIQRGSETLAWLFSDEEDTSGKANAAFICRAVNSFDELLAACKRARDIEYSVTQGQERELRVGYLTMLDMAIARAEPQE